MLDLALFIAVVGQSGAYLGCFSTLLEDWYHVD
jgi:hypothetical protein